MPRAVRGEAEAREGVRAGGGIEDAIALIDEAEGWIFEGLEAVDVGGEVEVLIGAGIEVVADDAVADEVVVEDRQPAGGIAGGVIGAQGTVEIAVRVGVQGDGHEISGEAVHVGGGLQGSAHEIGEGGVEGLDGGLVAAPVELGGDGGGGAGGTVGGIGGSRVVEGEAVEGLGEQRSFHRME